MRDGAVCSVLSARVGGEIILEKAREVLKVEFPHLEMEYVIPTEEMKGIGQAVAAAAMPEIKAKK